jgi:hypothetical protein
MIRKKFIFIITAVLCFFSSCDLLDCTQGQVSLLRIKLTDLEGHGLTLSDTLTITTCGTDSILLNRATGVKEILLPLSYHYPVDTFILRHYNNEYLEIDSLFVGKSNDIYFESPDCPTVMMHNIGFAKCSENFVDSVSILANKVDFYEVTHLQLFINSNH